MRVGNIQLRRGIVLIFILTFVFQSISYGAGAALTYSVSVDDKYYYEVSYSQYANGSPLDVNKLHSEIKKMVYIHVSLANFIGLEGTVEIDGYFLNIGSEGWKMSFSGASFTFPANGFSLGTYPAFVDGEIDEDTIMNFFKDAPFFVPTGLSEENWTVIKNKVLLNVQNAYRGIGEATEIDDEIVEGENGTFSVINIGPGNNYTLDISYNSDGILSKFYIWTPGEDANNQTIQHTVIRFDLIDRDYDINVESNKAQIAENIVISAFAVLGVIFIIWYRRKNAAQVKV